jgi:NAD+ synthase (glutamine-hydrolysing)
MAQFNPTVGAMASNTERIISLICEAEALSVDLLTFPEMAITGYPPEDLLFKPSFIQQNQESLRKITEHVNNTAVVIGFIDSLNKDKIYNAAALLYDKKLIDIYHKIHLPNYGVFDERRYFQEGARNVVFNIYNIGVGITICEDIWHKPGPAITQAQAGAQLLLNISASPYSVEKRKARQAMLSAMASDNIAIVAYNNMVGGQDELVFDGNSMLFDEKGALLAQGKQFEEDFIVHDLDIEAISRSRLHGTLYPKNTLPADQTATKVVYVNVPKSKPTGPKPTLPSRQIKPVEKLDEIYQALVLGTRDYIHKNGFCKVVIGLSGGIDSSLVGIIAVDALGAKNVTGIAMPSPYTSAESQLDAEKLARNLSINFSTIAINKILDSYLETLTDSFRNASPDTTEENIQARIRGNILMALSNKFGWLVLTTSNKSESATGYTTLYGDMAGGFAILKDIPKTMVYDLSRHRNRKAGREIIPASILTKAPSAELREGQQDIDTLPPYEILDPILKAYVEEGMTCEQIYALGFDVAVVRKVLQLVDSSEYKRRQSPPGIKITPLAFGRDRRLPITNLFKS